MSDDHSGGSAARQPIFLDQFCDVRVDRVEFDESSDPSLLIRELRRAARRVRCQVVVSNRDS